jgi:hypothetical protein
MLEINIGGFLLSLITIFLLGQLDHFAFMPISSPQTAGNPFTVTIYAYDENNNIYPYSGPVIVFSSPGPEFGNQTVTFNSGVWQGSFAATLADTYSIRCLDFSSPPHTGESNQIVFNPSTPYKLLTILPYQTYYPGIDTGKTGSAMPQQAGTYFNISVYLTDYWSNLVNSVNDSFEVSTTDEFTSTQYLQLNNGTAAFPFAFRTATYHYFYAHDVTNASIKTDTSSRINIYPGEYSRLLVLLPGETHLPGDSTGVDFSTPGKSGEPDDQYALDDFMVLVYAADSMWNMASISDNQVTLYSDFLFSNPPPQNLSNGQTQFTIHFTQSGDNQNLWAKDNNITSYRNYLNIVAVPDTSIPPDSFIVYPNPLVHPSQSMKFIYTLSVPCDLVFAIYDPFGNLVYKQNIAPGAEGSRAGINVLTWNGRNDKNKKVATGVYYAIIKGYTHTQKIIEKKTRVGVVW